MACMRWLYLLLFLAAVSEGKDSKEKFVVKTCHQAYGNLSLSLYKIILTSYSCTHVAWGVVNSTDSSLTGQYPSMFIAYSRDTETCDCRAPSVVDDIFLEEASVVVDSDVSMGVIFKGIYGFSATKGKKTKLAADNLNLTYACSAENDTDEDNYFPLNQIEEWRFVEENQTFIGQVGNFTQFSIRIGLPEKTGSNRLSYFPKTLFHENSTTFDFICGNYSCTDNCSRLALEILLVHGANLKNGSIILKKTTDDEYTPSVFSSYTYEAEANTASPQNNHTWFLQWKPISYQDANRKSTSSQQVVIVPTGDADECLVHELPDSMVSRMYKGHHGNITRWFVAFGTSGDDSYLSPTYNTWTVAIGAVTVPSEKFSLEVIITIIVGFGVPGGLVILSMVYVVLRRKPWQNVSRWMRGGSRGYTRLS